jgi:hypothetical protein
MDDEEARAMLALVTARGVLIHHATAPSSAADPIVQTVRMTALAISIWGWEPSTSPYSAASGVHSSAYSAVGIETRGRSRSPTP